MSSAWMTWISNPKESHGPLMSITTWTLTGIAFAFLAVRLFIRRSHSKLWLDDLILSISWVILLAQVILTQLAINLGFGKHALDVDFSKINQVTYMAASTASISVFAVTLSKISFGVTMLRLAERWSKYYVYFAIVTLAVFAVPAVVLPWVQCTPIQKSYIDIIPGKCINKHPSVRYGRFQAIWSAIMDISLALMPWKILWRLQMQFAEKIGVCIAMSLGILAGATAIFRAHYVEQLIKEDVSYDAYNTVIWSVAEASMTIVATSIPVLRVFLKQALSSVIGTYHNSPDPSKDGFHSANSGSANAQINLQRMNKRLGNETITESYSRESLVKDSDNRSSKGCLEMDNSVADEHAENVTMTISEVVPEPVEEKASPWTL